MKVRVQYGTREAIISIPGWHYELFRNNPEEYLAPFFDHFEYELEWEVIEQ